MRGTIRQSTDQMTMGFQVEDVFRLPMLILLDAALSLRMDWMWQYGSLVGFFLTFIVATFSLGVFCCETSVICNIYRLMLAVIVHCLMQGWNFSTIQITHFNFYDSEGFNVSMLSRVTDHMWNNQTMSAKEIDFTVKASICFGVLQILHWTILMLLKERCSPASVLICTSPAWALMFNISSTTMSLVILVSEIPTVLLFLKKVEALRHGIDHFRFLRRNGNEILVDDLITKIQDGWVTCRVPSVLRLFFVFRCVWAFTILNGNFKTFSTSEYDHTGNSGLYYYFVSSPPSATPKSKYWEDWDGIEGYFAASDKDRNLTFTEGMAAILTDSLLSSFSVGAAISVLGHYCGVGLHDFVEGNDIMQGEALGMMSSILFCLLAIQTGLSSLPPWKRIVRLYRNSFLLLSAILHFFLDVVHPVLMTISPQSHIPFRKHINPLIVCFLLLTVPSITCYWLVSTKPLSTWMIALTAFNFELIVKTISSLTVYVLYVADSRSHTSGIVNLDEYVFWIHSISHVIEFICGLVMFFNGAYILFFESSNLLRAIMMCMHAYINIYRTFREGVKILNNRRTVNYKISSLTLVKVEEIDEQDRDVCSICYQDFTVENGEVRKTHCNHMFHFQCLRKWIFIQDSCPMCDRALFPAEKEENKEN